MISIQIALIYICTIGNKVVSRLNVHGTHQGDFQGIPASGKQISVSGISIWELADGKLLQERVSWDVLGLMQQLGVVPSGQTG